MEKLALYLSLINLAYAILLILIFKGKTFLRILGLRLRVLRSALLAYFKTAFQFPELFKWSKKLKPILYKNNVRIPETPR